MLTLTVVAACVDAISYLGLGRVFPANMTGNTVLLAIGAAAGKAGDTARSASALGAFVVAAALAGLAGGRGRWDRVTWICLSFELALLAAAVVWWSTSGVPHGAGRYALIALFGGAMGVQSATIARLEVGVSTTYITGTWTKVSRWAARRVRGRDRADSDDDGALPVLVLACYLLAALAAGFVYTQLH